MPLLLATHTLVEAPTATVPFHVIVLNDLIKRRALPAALRCRMVLPTSGTVRPPPPQQQQQRSWQRSQKQQQRRLQRRHTASSRSAALLAAALLAAAAAARR